MSTWDKFNSNITTKKKSSWDDFNSQYTAKDSQSSWDDFNSTYRKPPVITRPQNHMTPNTTFQGPAIQRPAPSPIQTPNSLPFRYQQDSTPYTVPDSPEFRPPVPERVGLPGETISQGEPPKVGIVGRIAKAILPPPVFKPIDEYFLQPGAKIMGALNPSTDEFFRMAIEEDPLRTDEEITARMKELQTEYLANFRKDIGDTEATIDPLVGMGPAGTVKRTQMGLKTFFNYLKEGRARLLRRGGKDVIQIKKDFKWTTVADEATAVRQLEKQTPTTKPTTRTVSRTDDAIPPASIRNIADDDLGELVDFIDAVRTKRTPTSANFTATARLAKRFDIDPNVSDTVLATKLQNAIERDPILRKKIASRRSPVTEAEKTEFKAEQKDIQAEKQIAEAQAARPARELTDVDKQRFVEYDKVPEGRTREELTEITKPTPVEKAKTAEVAKATKKRGVLEQAQQSHEKAVAQRNLDKMKTDAKKPFLTRAREALREQRGSISKGEPEFQRLKRLSESSSKSTTPHVRKMTRSKEIPSLEKTAEVEGVLPKAKEAKAEKIVAEEAKKEIVGKATPEPKKKEIVGAISEELKGRITTFLRPSRKSNSRAFALLGNKDTTVPLFKRVFDDWVKGGTKVIIEPYAGAYTLGTHSIQDAIKSGLKQFHSNIFDAEKFLIVKSLQNGQIKRVKTLVDESVQKLSDAIRKHGTDPEVKKILDEFFQEHPNSYIGSAQFNDFLKKRPVGSKVTVFEDDRKMWANTFQKAYNELFVKDFKGTRLDSAVLNEFIKRTGIFGGKGQPLVGVNGFRSFEAKIYGKYGVTQAYQDIVDTFNLAKRHGTQIQLYNEDGAEMIKRARGVVEPPAVLGKKDSLDRLADVAKSSKISETAYYMDPPYVKTADVYANLAEGGNFASGQAFVDSHRGVFDDVQKGAKIALTNDVHEEYIRTVSKNVPNGQIFAYKEGTTPTSLIVSNETDSVVKGFLSETEATAKRAIIDVNKQHGNTDRIISKLKNSGLTDEEIGGLKLENGVKLVDTVKVKREKNGVLSAVITKKELEDITKAFKGTNLNQKWIPTKTAMQKAKEAGRQGKLAVLDLYEIEQIVFDRMGLSKHFFDPVRAARRKAGDDRTAIFNKFVDAGLMKRRGIFTADRFNLSKAESENVGKYYLARQEKGGSMTLAQLSDKERKFVKLFDQTIADSEGQFYKTAALNGKEPGRVKNYAPIMTSDDMKLAQEVGDMDFIFRKHPSFFSLKERAEKVPYEMYELDYRKIAIRWIDQMTAFNNLGRVGPKVKYLANSEEFKDIVGDRMYAHTNKWLKDTFNPAVKTPIEKGLGLVRHATSAASLMFAYASVVKQVLSSVAFTIVEKAPPKLRSQFARDFGLKVRDMSSITERKGSVAIMDVQDKFRTAGFGPLVKVDQKVAELHLNRILDQNYKKMLNTGKPMSLETRDEIMRISQDTIDMWMGGMTSEQLPTAFRRELGRTLNMFIHPLTFQLNGFVYAVAKAKGIKNPQKVAEVVAAAVTIAYMEQVITNLSFNWSDKREMQGDVFASLGGNVPVISQLWFAFKTDQPISPSPVLTAFDRARKQLVRYGNGSADEIDVGFAVAELFGLPKTVRRAVEGTEVIMEGGIRDKNGKLLAPVETLPNQIRTFLKGKYGSIPAQDYARNGFGTKAEDRRWKVPEVEFLQNGDYDRKVELYEKFDQKTKDFLYNEMSDGQQDKLDSTIEKKPILPIYEKVKKLDEEGKGGEAGALENALTDDEWEVYKKIRAAARAKHTSEFRDKLEEDPKSAVNYLNSLNKDELLRIEDLMTDEEWNLYKSAQ